MHQTLITGAPGWLGTRLAEVLANPEDELNKYSANKDRKVRCLVLPEENLSSLKNPSIEKVKGNVLEKQSLATAMEGVQTVFHLVGIIHPKKISDLYLVNRDGLKNVLDAAIAAGVKRLVFVSSNSPAGANKSRSVLMTEGDAPNPYMNYGKSKLQAEQLALQAHAEEKIEVVIIRPCWFYGPGQPARQSRFFRMIKKGNPIIFGNGENLRSMSYVDNTIQGLLLAEAVKEAAGNVYWIADEKPYATKEIYNTVAELLQVQLKPIHVPLIASQICEQIDRTLQAMNIYSTDFHVAGEMVYDIACSIDKAKRELGYRPTIGLREGMKRSLDWCAQNGQII